MIGLYVQNKHTLNELCRLFSAHNVIPYDPTQTYDCVVWLTSHPAPKGVPTFTIRDISLPLSLAEWYYFLTQSTASVIYYHNKSFTFDASQRLIIRLKDQQHITLTEKENELLTFLCQAPSHMASRDTILQSVWQYSSEADTHTLESHIYTLKQKLGEQVDQLIKIKNGIIQLV